MNLIEYREQIDRLIRGESDVGYMHNGSEAHAAIIVGRMFAHAKNTMQILTRRLDPAIYENDELIDQAKSFASDPKTTTQILVEDISDESLRIHDMSPLAELPNFAIRRLPVFLAKQIKFNYSVMDRRGIRFEDDKTKVNALVNFKNLKLAQDTANYFDNLWGVSFSAPTPIKAVSAPAQIGAVQN